jgi:putative ABC transport system permease protein
MDFKESFSVAISALLSNRVRLVLTMLGIIIGVGAVIAMVALGQGAKQAVESQIQQLGTNLLTVRSGTGGGGMFNRAAGASVGFTLDHLKAIREQCKTIETAIPELNQFTQIKYANQVTYSQILGTEPEYEFIRNAPLEQGEYFTNADNSRRNRVCVIGEEVRSDLFGENKDVVGEQVKIRGINFTIVGLLKSKGEGFGDPDNTVIVPLLTAQKRLFGTDRLSQIDVKVASLEMIDAASMEIEQVLRKQNRLAEGDENNFIIRSQLDYLNTFGEASKTLTTLLAAIAAVSLLVGGIGIMNIMLVSVTERTREIGVRMAIGARKKDIRYQFLIEAIVIAMAGGIIGILAGVGGAMALAKFANWNTAIVPGAVVLAFVFSGVVGVVFGLFPAIKASNLNPIDSLRYE